MPNKNITCLLFFVNTFFSQVSNKTNGGTEFHNPLQNEVYRENHGR